MGDRHFGIYSSFAEPELQQADFLERAKDISIYLLKMIDYGLQAHLDLGHRRVVHALALLHRLQVICRNGDSYAIADEQVLSFAKQGVAPFEARLILAVLHKPSLEKNAFKHATLAIAMCVCLHTRESLRKQRAEGAASRPTALWRKGGYVESCLTVIAECEATELYLAREGESESFRRNSSKMEESESDPFGSFYQLIENASGGLEGEKRSVPTFLQQNSIEEEVFYRVREEIDHYRDLFAVPKLSVLSDTDYFAPVLKEYAALFR